MAEARRAGASPGQVPRERPCPLELRFTHDMQLPVDGPRRRRGEGLRRAKASCESWVKVGVRRFPRVSGVRSVRLGSTRLERARRGTGRRIQLAKLALCEEREGSNPSGPTVQLGRPTLIQGEEQSTVELVRACFVSA